MAGISRLESKVSKPSSLVLYVSNTHKLFLKEMKISIPSILVFWAFTMATFQATGQIPLAHGLIRPGGGVAGVELGSKFSSFVAVFPPHPRFDEDHSYWDCGGFREYHWLDIDKRANGLYVYLKNDEIFQLSIQTPRFMLANGIRLDASEKQVKAAYPRGREHVPLGSGGQAVGGKDLVYWVDEGSGVAFQFQWDRRTKRRFLAAIDVFARKTDYRPDGCVAVPQQWKVLENHN